MQDLPTTDFFRLARDGTDPTVVRLTLDRPDRANAMSPDFWRELPTVCAALDADPDVRCVVLDGAGRHFCGGMDLSTFADISAIQNQEPGRASYALRRLILDLQASLTALEQMRVPVIAAVHGATLGGAIDLICACDMRLASACTSFGIEEIAIGMAADVGTLQRLPKLMAPGVVAQLAYTGERFGAEAARGWGFVNAVHPDREATVEAALSLARGIAARSPLAVAGIKRALLYARDHTVPDGLDQIATWNAGMLRPADLGEAMGARAAKREATFAPLPIAGTGG